MPIDGVECESVFTDEMLERATSDRFVDDVIWEQLGTMPKILATFGPTRKLPWYKRKYYDLRWRFWTAVHDFAVRRGAL